MQKVSVKERRKYVRVLTNDIIKCERYEVPPPEKREKQEALMKNISAGGILFESREKFDIWDVLKLEINLPGWEKCRPVFQDKGVPYGSKPLVSLASVVRVEFIDKNLFDIGVYFKNMDDETWLTLLNYVDKRKHGQT